MMLGLFSLVRCCCCCVRSARLSIMMIEGAVKQAAKADNDR